MKLFVLLSLGWTDTPLGDSAGTIVSPGKPVVLMSFCCPQSCSTFFFLFFLLLPAILFIYLDVSPLLLFSNTDVCFYIINVLKSCFLFV